MQFSLKLISILLRKPTRYYYNVNFKLYNFTTRSNIKLCSAPPSCGQPVDIFDDELTCLEWVL